MGGFRYEVITEYWPLFLEGAKMTIQITVICVTLGVILGMALGMARLQDIPLGSRFLNIVFAGR